MASPLTIYKLMILYLLDKVEEGITKAQISEFLIENGYINLISLLTTYAEIEETGLVRSEIMEDKTLLYITKEGKETLAYFSSTLGSDLRESMDTFLKSKGQEIREEADIVYEYYKNTNGGYNVELSVREQKTQLFGITLTVPDKQTAQMVIENWKEKNTEIYRSVIEKLF